MAKPKESMPVKSEPKDIKKAFSIERVKDGWSFIIYTIDNGQIIDVNRSEPDLKALTIEKFKIAAFKYWSSIG